MISEQDRLRIAQIARRYGVGRVMVFGSSADPHREGDDIDVGVEGIVPEKFFRFYGDLIFALSKPVDVVDLSGRSKFTDRVKREGITVYVRPK